MTKARDLADGVINTSELADGSITTAKINDGDITSAKIADTAITAAKLNVSGNGTAGQVLKSDGDGSFTWADTAEPFTPTTVSGTTPSLDLGTYNYFSSGSLTGNTTISFANTPTAKRFFYDQTGAGIEGTGYAANDIQSSYTSKSNTTTDFSSDFTNLGGIAFKPDGTKMYLVGTVSYIGRESIREYDLSTAWDISTATLNGTVDVKDWGFYWEAGATYNAASQVWGMTFSSDGSYVYLMQRRHPLNDDAEIYQGTLSTAWDITTASYTRQKQLEFVDGGYPYHNCIYLASDGTFFITVRHDHSGGGQYLDRWNMSTAYNISTASKTYSSTNLSISTDTKGVDMSSDGTVAWIYTNTSVRAYPLSTAYRPDTLSTSYVSFGGSPVVSTPHDMKWGDSGKLLFSVSHSSSLVGVAGPATLPDTPYTLSFPASVQNPDYAATQALNDRYLHEFITTDGGTNVWLVGSTKYDNN